MHLASDDDDLVGSHFVGSRCVFVLSFTMMMMMMNAIHVFNSVAILAHACFFSRG